MKNNQKNRNRKPRNNQHPQQRVPGDFAKLMNSLPLIGADISISDEPTIPVPRDEYDELLFCSTLVDILHRLYQTNGKYAVSDLLDNIFKNEKEDK